MDSHPLLQVPEETHSANSKKTVVVGMSGGVDSSVTALLLKKQGYQVIGLFMRNWEEIDGSCTAEEDYADVESVCSQIGIPYYTVDFVKEYWEGVFQKTLDDLKAGYTPNPDILCNREIKFDVFFKKAMQLGADFLATGHYSQRVCQEGKYHLSKGLDPLKDQSYFLHAIKGSVLDRVLFPIGSLPKKEVRELALFYKLTTAKKKDSTGICFIGKRDFKSFISQYLPMTKGPLKRLDGTTVGEHQGAFYYTIGQRRGLGIGGEGEPWFVVGKEIETNTVYIERGTRHTALFCDEVTVEQATWIQDAPQLPFVGKAKVRYRQRDQECVLKEEEGTLKALFSTPQRAVTPGQSIVFYDGNLCLGGGVIAKAGPSYYEQSRSLPHDVDTL